MVTLPVHAVGVGRPAGVAERADAGAGGKGVRSVGQLAEDGAVIPHEAASRVEAADGVGGVGRCKAGGVQDLDVAEQVVGWSGARGNRRGEQGEDGCCHTGWEEVVPRHDLLVRHVCEGRRLCLDVYGEWP